MIQDRKLLIYLNQKQMRVLLHVPSGIQKSIFPNVICIIQMEFIIRMRTPLRLKIRFSIKYVNCLKSMTLYIACQTTNMGNSYMYFFLNTFVGYPQDVQCVFGKLQFSRPTL